MGWYILPRLYKRNVAGKIQLWHVVVEDATIVVSYGELGGKLQTTRDQLKEGKSHTTPAEQAKLEAEALWRTQIKRKGYVESLDRAMAGENDQAGGIAPMLAHKYRDHATKIVWPAFVQPKLDGIRCIAVLEDGHCTLWSRSCKPITSCPHIIKEIEKNLEYLERQAQKARRAKQYKDELQVKELQWGRRRRQIGKIATPAHRRG